MVSFNKKLKLVVLGVLFLPLGAYASTSDYLVVSANYSDGVFSNVVAETNIIESSEVRIYKTGTYEMDLYDESGVLSKNFFEIPKLGTVEVVGRDSNSGIKTYGTAKETSSFINVTLPFTKSVRPEDSGIQIKKGKTIVFDKKLSEIGLSVISSSINELILPPPIPVPSIAPMPEVKPLINNTDWMKTTTPISTETPTVPIAKNSAPKDIKGIMLISFSIIGLILVVFMWMRSKK